MVVVFVQLLYAVTLWTDDTQWIFKFISGAFIPMMLVFMLVLEYKTVKLIHKGTDMLYDHTFMNDYIAYFGREFSILQVPVEVYLRSNKVRTIYVSRYLYLLLINYECETLVYHRYAIRFKVDPYRREYSYGRTRLDRYVCTKDIFE